jgi:hypothetical protein
MGLEAVGLMPGFRAKERDEIFRSIAFFNTHTVNATTGFIPVER